MLNLYLIKSNISKIVIATNGYDCYIRIRAINVGVAVQNVERSITSKVSGS